MDGRTAVLSLLFAGILFAMVGVAWTIDKRTARRKQDEFFELGRIVQAGVSQLTQHEKDMLFADVMADHHERNLNVNERDWNWYAVGTLAFAVTCVVLSALVWLSM